MLKADIYTYNKVEYIVIDTAMITIENKGLATLASYRHGVGADRILLVDKSLEQIIAAVDGQGSYQLLSVDDVTTPPKRPLMRKLSPNPLYENELFHPRLKSGAVLPR